MVSFRSGARGASLPVNASSRKPTPPLPTWPSKLLRWHCVAVTTPADASETIRLWPGPDGPPTVIDGVPDEVEYAVRAGLAAGTTFLRNISDPTLSVFAPAPGSGNGVGVIVIPGGGWTINAWSHEGVDVARWLVALGYTAFVLKYRLQASNPDQAAFEARMAAIDGGLSAPMAASKKPREIGKVISTDAYLQARVAAADDGRRAI